MDVKHLNHFSHQHPLTLYVCETENKESYWDSSKCHLCARQANGSIYGCRSCGLFIHNWCAEFAQFLTHPFHPQHTLSLYEYDHHLSPVNASSSSEKKKCNACGKTCATLIYHCAECKFYLDEYCIKIKPQTTGICRQTSENSQSHPLFICNTPTGAFYCSFCEKQLYEEEVYVCINCKTSLHELCSRLPRHIKHQFHPEHPLDLLRKSWGSFWGKPLKCNACSWSPDYGIGEYYYHCSQCNFTLHSWCASLSPTSSKTNSESGTELQNQLLAPCHSHPLVQCDNTKELVKSRCFGCNSKFEDSVFICLKCGILLDKSCTELLPEISHPFHPLHPLNLVEDIHKKYRYKCRGCKTITDLFTYVCWKCDFYLDPWCAMTRPLMINSKAHQHPLAFIKTKLSKYSYFSCNTCGGTFQNNFFQCVECEFGLHLECYPFLPRVIKHDCHCDPLRLTYSQIEDIPDEDGNEEFYCYACEEPRDPRDPTYCCKECPFVAHFHCVLSEIMSYTETESAKVLLGTSAPMILEEEDEAPITSTDVPTAKAKETLAALDKNAVRDNVTIENDNTNKKTVATPDEDIIKENLSTQDEDIRKEKVASLDTEVVKENITAQDEDIIIKKRVVTPDKDAKENSTAQNKVIKKKATLSDKEIIEENVTLQEDIFYKKVTSPHEQIVEDNVTAQDENILQEKDGPPEEEIDTEKAIAEHAAVTEKEVVAPYQNIVKQKDNVPDKDSLKTKIATINEEIAVLRTKLNKLKERRKQFLHPQSSVNQRIKHVIRNILP